MTPAKNCWSRVSTPDEGGAEQKSLSETTQFTTQENYRDIPPKILRRISRLIFVPKLFAADCSAALAAFSAGDKRFGLGRAKRPPSASLTLSKIPPSAEASMGGALSGVSVLAGPAPALSIRAPARCCSTSKADSRSIGVS